MRRGGRILARVLRALRRAVQPGVTTLELDALVRSLTSSLGGEPAFLDYRPAGSAQGFPAALCVSVNHEVVHGLPGRRSLLSGDVVGLDFGVRLDGYYTDSAITVGVGAIAPEARWLLRVTEEALYLGVNEARVGKHLGDIGCAVQRHVEKSGFSVVRDLVGHGIGRALHESPEVPNFGRGASGQVLQEGMVLAIEPMVALGDARVRIAPDGWTYETADGSLAAHFEHTVAVTRRGPIILSK